MKGFILASPFSGSGKTVVTVGLLRALKQKGIAFSPAKAGPDYIDPAFHYAACGIVSFNLDSWCMRPDLIHFFAHLMTKNKEIIVVEAMMGLFDGAADKTGSAADLACLLDLPILLIVDCSKFSHSIAPLVYGFANYCPDVPIAGIILNKVGGERHENLLRSALRGISIPLLGIVPQQKLFHLPSRHLGLVQACEHKQLKKIIDNMGNIILSHLDVKSILRIAYRKKYDILSHQKATILSKDILLGPTPLGNHIAIARDDAFRFIYPHLLTIWHQQGAMISFFSPLADEEPDSRADAVYLPGGYPELYANKLAKAFRFKKAMQKMRQKRSILYGECGGFMVLGNRLEDEKGRWHKMLGFLPLTTSFRRTHLQLGYRKFKSIGSFLWKKALRGHEFHYATLVWQGEVSPLFEVWDALNNYLGFTGLRKGNIAGSFLHIIDYEK